MSISSEINRISGNVSDALTAIANKGVTVPSGSNSDDLADLIGQISGGGGTTWETVYEGQININNYDNPQDTIWYTGINNVYTAIELNSVWRITWDSVVYDCTATDEGMTEEPSFQLPYAIGNYTYAGSQGGSDIPFMMQKFWGTTLVVLSESHGLHTVKIEKQVSGGGGSTLITKTITANGTYDAEDDDADGYSEVTVALPSGTEGTPTATKGTVSNHSVSVTPSVTNTAGVITGGTKTGTAVTVSASELVSGSETKTSNGTYDVTNLASLVVNVSGGSGIGTLLNTTSIGSVNTTSTQAASLNVSCEVSGINSYDLLIVESSVNSTTNNRHTATVGLIFLTAGSAIGTKNGATIATAKWNSKLSNTGTATTSVSTTAYGIYPNSCSISNGTATIPMYRRYNSTSTGTINGTYTARVYGVKLYDLIGG